MICARNRHTSTSVKYAIFGPGYNQRASLRLLAIPSMPSDCVKPPVMVTGLECANIGRTIKLPIARNESRSHQIKSRSRWRYLRNKMASVPPGVSTTTQLCAAPKERSYRQQRAHAHHSMRASGCRPNGNRLHTSLNWRTIGIKRRDASAPLPSPGVDRAVMI